MKLNPYLPIIQFLVSIGALATISLFIFARISLADQFVVDRFRGYDIETETILYLSTAGTTVISLIFHLYFLSGRSAESSIKKFIDRNKAVAIIWNVVFIALWAASLGLMFELSNRWTDIVADFVDTKDANLMRALGNSTVRFDKYAELARLSAITSLSAGIVAGVFLVTLLVGLYSAIFQNNNDISDDFGTEQRRKNSRRSSPFSSYNGEYHSRDWEV
jgi:hypothetical protein